MLFKVFGGFLLLISITVGAAAQEPQGVPIQPAPKTHQTLSGEIRWKKSLGVTPFAPKDDESKVEYRCARFFVLVKDIEKDNEIVTFANLLKTGEKEDYYVCSFKMTVPVKRRLWVAASYGDGLSQDPDVFREKRVSAPWGITVRMKWDFYPAFREVTLGSVRGTYVGAFELAYRAQ